jgi:hypothetical protein
VRWSRESAAVEVTSRWELELLLTGLSARAARSPCGAEVTFPDGTTLHIALGRPEGVLVIHEPEPGDDGLRTEWISVGGASRRGHTAFLLFDESWDQENRSLLPTRDTIHAVGELFETGQRPTSLRWEQNQF